MTQSRSRPMEIAIEFKKVTKTYPKTSGHAVNDVSARIYNGEFITILGSSGSGKTTLLKMVNRLIDPNSGTIEVLGHNIQQQDPVQLRRNIGYVIQQIGLFPHMTIKENIAVVMRLLKWDNQAIQQRVDELLDLVNLDPKEYRHRYPSQLSGGQQQRVGLARALASNPSIMLLDEPFGALDAITRISLQEELLLIHQQSQKTFLFVTHDINEAFRLGSRVIIMDQGEIQQFDTPQNIIKAPVNEFVEKLITVTKQQHEVWETHHD